MTSKIVNVVLNSNNKVSGTNNQATYYMDWSAILKNNTPYYLHFTYIGGRNVCDGQKLATVYVDFNTSSNKQNSSTSFGASSTQMLGYLKIQQLAPNNNFNYLTAEDNTNCRLYLESRPLNNNFTVTIFDNAAPPTLFTDASGNAVPANYILILSFQEANEKDED